MTEICQSALDEFGIPAEWASSIVVPIFKGQVDIKTCSCYGTVKLLEHSMKVMERVL